MKPAVSQSYLNSVIASRQYDGLAWLSSMICGGEEFDVRASTYGLPEPLFLFVESLTWFAQGMRSGAWTYYEATPASRQQQMLSALAAAAPEGFAEHYSLGMQTWARPDCVREVNAWLELNDGSNNEFLWQLVARNRSLIDERFS